MIIQASDRVCNGDTRHATGGEKNTYCARQSTGRLKQACWRPSIVGSTAGWGLIDILVHQHWLGITIDHSGINDNLADILQ